MKEVRYYVTRFGTGLKGHGGTTFEVIALASLRRRLHRHTKPLYHLASDPTRQLTLDSTMARVKIALDASKVSHKEVVHGQNYDDPGYAIFKIVGPELMSPLVTALMPFIGKSSYQLTASGPPGPSDCSGSTSYAAHKAYGIELPHSANEQGHLSSSFHYFYNADDLQAGDFIFYKYTDRVGDSPDAYDHVDICVKSGLSIGSRPSTNGINYYHWLNGAGGDRPDFAALKYGRLGHA